jgi:hypothetical protein
MRALGAFGLGLVSFVLFMFIGESAGLMPAFITMAVYFFGCQFLLSRGNPEAHHEDWLIMVALDSVMLTSVMLMIAIENPNVFVEQGLGALVATCGGTYSGAFAASLSARRSATRH